jgi:hypothetical protein
MVEEQRLRDLELRMDLVVERLDEVEAAAGLRLPGEGAAPEPPRFAAPAESRAAAPSQVPTPPAAKPKPKPKRRSLEDLVGGRSLEDLLGGSVLAWVGGLAVLIGVAFLFAVGVSRGWIGEGARVLMAGAGAAALLTLGIWLHERRGRTEAALAAVATGISALFVTFVVGAQVYDVLPAPVALGMTMAVGALATYLAVRWEAQGIAALGIGGALVSPALAGAPAESGTIAILFVAAASAVGVLVRQRWDWLCFGVFLITMPQWIVYLVAGRPALEILVVLAAFGLLGAAAAVGYELRMGADTIRPCSAFLLSLNAVVLAAAGAAALSIGGEETLAKLWIAALGLVHLGIGLWCTRTGRASHDFGLLSLVIGALLANVAFAAFIEGPARALGWAGAGIGFALLIRRGRLPVKDEGLTALGLGVHVALALLQALISDAPLALLDSHGPVGVGAAISLAGVAAACLVSARLADAGQHKLRIGLDIGGLAVAAYLTALMLDGALLTLAWSLEAVVLAKLATRVDDEVAAWGSRAHVFLASIHAVAVVAPISAVTDGLAEPLSAIVAVGSVAGAAAACALLTGRELQGVRQLLEMTAMAALAYLAAVTLDGAALVAVLAAGAVVLAEIARRFDREFVAYGALAYLAVGVVHVLGFEAPPSALVTGLDAAGEAAIALGALVASAIVCATSGQIGSARPGVDEVPMRQWLLGAAAVAALYLASVLVVTPFQPGNATATSSPFDLDVRQQGQVLLSALWSLAGFGALVFGLRRDLQVVRLSALALLLLTVGKVFLFDLATLTSIYRVASFIGLGLFLLTAAFVWQRMRPRPLPDMRSVPEGVR